MTAIDEPTRRAIPTHYADRKFRSRLEARWAVFFDSVGRKYTYETQGYQLPNGLNYLPDFYLPEIKTWVEVKGVMAEDDEEKILGFARWRNEPIAVLGDIPEPKSQGPHFHMLGKPYGSPVVAIFSAVWTLTTSGVRAEQHGIPTYVLPNDRFPENGWAVNSSPTVAVHALLDESYRAARNARFEHGENPRRERIQEATSVGEWWYVPGDDMSHYFLAGIERCICDHYSLDGHLGHLGRGVKVAERCYICELWLGQRKQAMRRATAVR